jgi:hypothetical protein
LVVPTTDQKGAIAEMAVIKAAMTVGIGVLRPWTPERYDLIFDLRPKRLRVLVQVGGSSRRRRRGSLPLVPPNARPSGLPGSHTSEEVDRIAAYGAELMVHLRLRAPMNNQRSGIH